MEQSPPPLKRLERLWPVAIGLCFLLLLAAGAGVPASISAAPDDATVYWEAGLRMRAGGDDLYGNPGLENRVGRYIYPPAFAALFAPLTFVDGRPPASPEQRIVERPYRYPAGLHIWVWLHLPMLAAALWLLPAACGLPAQERMRTWGLCLLATIAAAYIDLDWGNVNLLILLLVVAGLALAEKQRLFLGGLLVGAAAMVKVLPGVLLLVFLLQGRPRAAWGVVAGALALWLLPLFWWAPRVGLAEALGQNFALFFEWVHVVAKPGVSGDIAFAGGTASPNVSLSAWLGRLFTEGAALTAFQRPGYTGPLLVGLPPALTLWLARLVAALMLGVALALAWLRRQSAPQRSLAAALALVAVHLGNPLCWPYHLVLLALPLCALAALDVKRSVPLAAVLIVGVSLPLLLYRVPGYGVLEQACIWGVPTVALLVGYTLGAGSLWRAGRQP
ncbi:MAG: hypothetical protein BroJett014_17470 [Planctomycetota bacterium]|nr:hypothetical protein [Planctomycetota bacterium]GIK52774.1 MAG: hypothetical protein BroJett014_17470 [Planctomycetota bacterium]